MALTEKRQSSEQNTRKVFTESLRGLVGFLGFQHGDKQRSRVFQT